MTTILFAFAAMLSWGFGDFFIQKSIRKTGNIETLFWIGLIGTIALFPFVWPDLPRLWDKSTLLLALLLGLIVFLEAIVQFQALRQGKLSVVEVLLIIELPITILLGVIFLKEHIGWPQIVVMILLLFGIGLLSLKKNHFWQIWLKKILLIRIKSYETGMWLALSAGVLVAFVNFLTAMIAKDVTPLLAIWVPWLIFTIISFLFILRQKKVKTLFANIRTYKWLLLPTAVIDTLAWVFFALAVAKQELAITIAITESYPAVAMFLGLWINRERISKYQISGGIMAIGASIIISLIS